MDFLLDFLCGVVMVVLSYITFSWSKFWWGMRRAGYRMNGHVLILFPLDRWERAYPAYRFWTWFVRIVAWLLSLWQLCLALLWFFELGAAAVMS